MARYATDCMHKMHQVVRQLETTLGPETADLSMRIGLHSGPVTAGVLRGQRARFQLFGDAGKFAGANCFTLYVLFNSLTVANSPFLEISKLIPHQGSRLLVKLERFTSRRKRLRN